MVSAGLRIVQSDLLRCHRKIVRIFVNRRANFEIAGSLLWNYADAST
jgi:hypothetical protein